VGALAAAVVLGAAAPAAGAEPAISCPVTLPGASPRLAATDARQRLAFIDARLTAVGRQARVWAWGWGGGIAASGVASLVAVPFVQRADRVDWYTGAASAAVGVIPFAVAPLEVTRDARELHARLAEVEGAAATGAAGVDLCPLLLEAESRLVRDAENQSFQQRWFFHAGNVAFNTGIALFLGLGFHHWTSGIINGLAGVAVGEAIIFTQPVGTVRDLRDYRAATFADGPGAAW
jgi:hypothetical protein